MLTFLKWWRSLPKDTKESFTEATVQAEKALAERKAIREANEAEKSQKAWRTFQGKLFVCCMDAGNADGPVC